MRSCDVCVIGSGPGGYVAAIRAAQRGASAIVVERSELGGVCLNWGCIPTKALLHTAMLYQKLQHAADFGLKVGKISVDMAALLKRKDTVIRRNKSGISQLFKGNGIELVKGEASVKRPGLVTVGDEEIKAKSIVVATGSSPRRLPGLETDGKRVITHVEALSLKNVPKRVLVIGAGALGAEFACLWNALGSEVTVVEMLANVLPLDDEELTKGLRAIMKKRGVDIRTETTVKALDVTSKGVHVTLEGKKAGEVDVDLVLVGVGFKHHSEPVTASPDLGVKVDKAGRVLVDECLETSVPGIYAIGDVVGKTMLAHGASAEGQIAAENATGGRKAIDYRVVPHCTFTSPELAAVGLTETQALDAGIDIHIGRFPYVASGRAQTLGETDGMVKIIGDRATNEVVGVHILGAEAGELIAPMALAMAMEATVEDIAETIHTHPTLSEILKEAAEDYLGMGIHTPPGKS
jgi:dihydrolipoyl dehydrogenase